MLLIIPIGEYLAYSALCFSLRGSNFLSVILTCAGNTCAHTCAQTSKHRARKCSHQNDTHMHTDTDSYTHNHRRIRMCEQTEIMHIRHRSTHVRHTLTHTHTQTHICTHLHSLAQTHTDIHIHKNIHAHTHTHTQVQTHKHTHTHTHTLIHIDIHTCTLSAAPSIYTQTCSPYS